MRKRRLSTNLSFKDSLEHIDAEKFSNILFLSYLIRVNVYLAVVKFITNTLSYNLLHFAIVCDVTNTCQDFDSWSKGYPTYAHAYNDSVIIVA